MDVFLDFVDEVAFLLAALEGMDLLLGGLLL